MSAAPTGTCPVCGAAASSVGVRRSRLDGREFALLRCSACAFVFVHEPRTDFESLYDERYYSGRGADPHVDYDAEMADPDTVRTYEWHGITRLVESEVMLTSSTQWLDFGCGLGGLVRWVRQHRTCPIVGFDDGYAGGELARLGIPHVTSAELTTRRGAFDVVTAIEVLEHTIDAVEALHEIAELLRPGGIVVLTTGNARPFQARLTKWSYTSAPDVHVSFFEPRNLALAMEKAGLEPVWPGWRPGFEDVIRYKVLKAFRVHSTNRLERLVPWRAVARGVDRRRGVSAMPWGRLR
jgi:SAM-dependent methyltransferase